LVGHPNDWGKCGIFFFFIFQTSFLSPFLFVILFLVNLFSFSNSNLPFDVCSYEKILMLVVNRCFGVQVLGTPRPLHTPVSSSHGIVSLDTLGTMCHLSLECGKTHCLFVCFIYLFCLFLSIKKNLKKKKNVLCCC
jgi:hypothetical protein